MATSNPLDNIFTQQAGTATERSASPLHRLVQPFVVEGLTVQQVLVEATRLVNQRGQRGAVELGLRAIDAADEIELRTVAAERRRNSR